MRSLFVDTADSRRRDPWPDAAARRWTALAAFTFFAVLLALAGALTAPSGARLRHGIFVGWAAFHTLSFVGWLLLYYRWTLRRGEVSEWLAVIALSGATYASGCTIRLYFVTGDTAPLSDSVAADLVMALGWLLLLRRALRNTAIVSRTKSLAIGLGIALAALTLHTVVVEADLPPADGQRLRLVLLVVLLILAALGLREVARAHYFRAPARRRLLAAGALVLASRIVAPTLPAAAGVRAAVAVGLALVAAAIFCSEAVYVCLLRNDRAILIGDMVAEHAAASERDEQLHEVRASLAGIVSAVHLLSSSNAQLPPSRRERFAEMLESEARRLERLLEDHPWAQAAGVHSLDDLIEPVIMSRRLTGQVIRWEPSGVLVRCAADPVAEALNILLVNAHKHAPDSPVTVDVVPAVGQVRLLVSDEGPGISDQVRDVVFTRRIRGTLSSGQGIGLQLAHRLVASQGGTLSLNGVAHRAGAMFELTLPSPITEELG